MRMGNRRQVLTIRLKTPTFVGMSEMSTAKRFTNFPLLRREPTANLFLLLINVHIKMRHFFFVDHDASTMYSKLYTCFRHDRFNLIVSNEQRPTLERRNRKMIMKWPVEYAQYTVHTSVKFSDETNICDCLRLKGHTLLRDPGKNTKIPNLKTL